MSLAKGTRLGQYEVLELIGKGGMGEVYRGFDTQLKRDVALKVLPEEFARDRERLARFRREATLLASLNHPNIAAIYRLEQSGDTVALVMEYVPGETLADRVLREGAVPLDESLDITKQICDALEHAHEKNIIHRDLKPANVKLTPEGRVKVLDFGLAKAFAADPADDVPDSQAPTLPPGASPTIPGAILGTAAYMSPEQARGKTVDKRTDIFALGCVLYELLTGKKVFDGETPAEILGAIHHKEPEWNALPENTPPAIRALLRRCLQKDARERLRDAADIRIQIDEARAAPAPAVPLATASKPLWRRWLPYVAALLLVLLAAAGGWFLKPAPTPRPVTRFETMLPPDQRLTYLDWPVIAISPNGTYIAYVAGSRGGPTQLYLRSSDSSVATPVPGTEGALYPFFSPDSQSVGLDIGGGRLVKVSTSGGAVSAICLVTSFMGATWGPDGTIIFGSGSGGLQRVSSTGGTPQSFTTLDTKRGEGSHAWPEFLPGGKAVLFASFGAGNEILVRRLDTGEQRTLIQDGMFPHYVPTGHLIYYQAGTVMAVSFDPVKLEVKGTPVPVLEGAMSTTSNTRGAQFSVSNFGTLLYLPGGPQGGNRQNLVWVDRKGAVQDSGLPPRQYAQPQISPDGRQVAVMIAAGSQDIWVYDFARHTLSRLTFEGNNLSPQWTPDGKRIAFVSSKAGPLNLFWKSADGTGAEEQLTKSEHLFRVSSLSPDGKLAFGVEQSQSNGRDLWVYSLGGDRKAMPFLQTHFDDTVPQISPDGHWLAYTSNDSGRFEIYVRPFPNSEGKWQISTEGGEQPRWSRNGRELFYRNGNKMMAVEITPQPGFAASTPKQLFEEVFERRAGGQGTNYDISPDGQRFLMVKSAEQQSAPTQLNVVVNWFEELKQKVPTGK